MYSPPNQPRELIEDAIEFMENGHKIALLTLINIEGNAPYPVGSQMLVRDDGQFIGQITGGCAEQALVDQALGVMQKGENTTERYGLNSRYFDIQLPCGSGIDIEFDTTTELSSYQKIANTLNKRQTFVAKPYKTYFPNERLLLVGQGPIMPILTHLAQQVGFEVYCIEQQTELASYCDAYTSLVSLFHEHDLEIDILTTALESNLFYIGALGSKRTHAKRLKDLSDKGFDAQALGKIHGPVGLDIGAVSPAQIAVSILSELISVMNHNGPFTQ